MSKTLEQLSEEIICKERELYALYAERKTLKDTLRRPTKKNRPSSQVKEIEATILPRIRRGEKRDDIARQYGVTLQTVRTWISNAIFNEAANIADPRNGKRFDDARKRIFKELHLIEKAHRI